MSVPLILVIDDSQTIRKLVDCHLTQTGYRVALAADADSGIEHARSLRPDLILLDHQLPGTTGYDVARQLLGDEATAPIPVVISSTLRNRAFVQYAECPNVVDQIPKPFTPEMLKSGVANALQTGRMVVRAQQEGTAVPEAVDEVRDPALEGDAASLPLRAVFDFLNNLQQSGRLTVEVGQDRIRFTLGQGRIQAAVSPTIPAARLQPFVPKEYADLEPLLAVTLMEHQDASMAGLVKLLERSLSDPRRLRGLLRFQASGLTYWALSGAAGRFAFEPAAAPPPMFQAFPLQMSLPALAIAGVRHFAPKEPADPDRVYARPAARGGNLDRAGMAPIEMKLLALIDGRLALGGLSQHLQLDLAEVAAIAQGLALAGLAEARSAAAGLAVLVIEEDPETARPIQQMLGPEGQGYRVQVVRDAVSAQILLRRNRFDLIFVGVDRPGQEALVQSLRRQWDGSARIVGIAALEDEARIGRLDALGIDAVLSRPVCEADLKDTLNHLREAGQSAPTLHCGQIPS